MSMSLKADEEVREDESFEVGNWPTRERIWSSDWEALLGGGKRPRRVGEMASVRGRGRARRAIACRRREIGRGGEAKCE